MEITRENFEKNFDLISTAIDDSTFLSIDCEFTGLDDGKDCSTNFDTPEERYEKLLKSVQSFTIVQFGLSAFIKSKSKINCFDVKTYTFYIFSQPSKYVPDSRFSCQCSSIAFLLSNGFDFSKVFNKGINFISMEKEHQINSDIIKKHNTFNLKTTLNGQETNKLSSPINLNEKQKDFINTQLKKVDDICKDEQKTSIVLEPCDSYLRKHLYEQLNSLHASKVYLETVSSNTFLCSIKITFIDNEIQKKDLEDAKLKSELEELYKSFGFTRIIKKLHTSNKLIVGHNLILDIMHILSQFWSPLPMSYTEFKTYTNTVFPRILDTKYMASSEPFKEYLANFNLKSLFQEIQLLNKQHKIKDSIEYMSNQIISTNEKFHDAGYDSYITGLCYIMMAQYLHTLSKDNKSDMFNTSSYENRLYLMKIADIPYINLVGDDLPLSRDNMFYMQFGKEVKKSDLQNLFSPYGNFNIKFLNEQSALVKLYNKDNAAAAKKSLFSLSKSPNSAKWFQIKTYDEFINSKDLVPTVNALSAKRKHPYSENKITSKYRKCNSSSDPDKNCDLSVKDTQKYNESADSIKPLEDKKSNEIINSVFVIPEWQ